jgi:glycosyltransferase involved in cell wall biosynthesis
VSERPRFAFVLPELPPLGGNQYAHHVPLLQEVARHAEVIAVVERPPAVEVPGVAVLCQHRRRPLGRALELAAILVRLRRRGYRYAYGSYSPYFGVVAGLLGRLIGVRTSYWHCRVDFFDRSIDRRWGIRDVLTSTLPLVLSLHLSRRVVTGTPGLADHYARTFRLPREKIAVVPNDIDLARWPRSGERDPATVLFLGRLTEHKGAHLLPEFWRELARLTPGAKLVIAGSGRLEATLARELADDIDAGRVTMVGAVSNDQASALMGAAAVYLLPSLSEGFPRVLLESMASGLPFVATDVGGVREVVSPAAQADLIAPGDADALAAAAARLLGDADLRERLAADGLEHVRRYDVARVAPELVDAVTRA